MSEPRPSLRRRTIIFAPLLQKVLHDAGIYVVCRRWEQHYENRRLPMPLKYTPVSGGAGNPK